MYYSVVTAIKDNGAISAIIFSVKADTKPQNSFKHTTHRDIYADYYDTLEEAVNALE